MNIKEIWKFILFLLINLIKFWINISISWNIFNLVIILKKYHWIFEQVHIVYEKTGMLNVTKLDLAYHDTIAINTLNFNNIIKIIVDVTSFN